MSAVASSFRGKMIDLDSLDGINIISSSSNSGSIGGSQLGAQQDEFKQQERSGDEQLRYREQEAQSGKKDHVDNLLTCMLITANVGTIFEEVSLGGDEPLVVIA